MTTTSPAPATMAALRFCSYGEPADVLVLQDAPVPEPGPGHIRVAVHATGLNPADWALCRGLFARSLPRGVGLDVAGVVTAAGDGVAGVRPGDRVLGSADYADYATAGASEQAVLSSWAVAPAGLDLTQAAALPLVVETAHRYLSLLGVSAGMTVVIHGAGSMIGFSAVQIALLRGARVVATAGHTFAGQLEDLGAAVTPYGDGMAGRVLALAGGPADRVLDAAPAGGALGQLVETAGGDPKHVATVADFAAAAEVGVRTGIGEGDAAPAGRVLAEFAEHAAAGRFRIPVARQFPLGEWRAALELSQSGHARGKVLLIP